MRGVDTKATRGRKAVFLDRDGTLNEEVGYLHRIEDFRWIPGAPEAVARLNRAGFLVIVVTNQAGVAHGYYDEEAVEALHAHMARELARVGGHIDAFYYCPYHPEATLPEYRADHPCRKPASGMFEQAIRDWGIDVRRSFAVGDRNNDLIPAARLGIRTILVLTGYGRAEARDTRADYVAADVGEAAEIILELDGRAEGS